MLGAIHVAADRLDFVKNAARAPGIVSALNAGGSHPQIEFVSQAGTAVSYPQGGLIFGYRTGDAVQVLYRPADPRRTACIDSFGALWFLPILFALGSAFFAAASFIAFREAGTIK